MHKPVNTILDEIENEYNCRVLFAVESGSRAWGFASPDSDYDVRFVYAHPLNWYLGLQEQRDTIERFYPGDIDCAGWELRKALRLFAGCNLSLNEWLGSPTVYRANDPLFDAMRARAGDYFNPQKAIHHYLGTARSIFENHLDGDRINIKKLFYIVRPLLASAWAAERRTMPPVLFSELLEAGLLEDTVLAEVRKHLARKLESAESGAATLSADLRRWIDESFIRLHQQAHEIGRPERPGWEPLNGLFRAAIGAP